MIELSKEVELLFNRIDQETNYVQEHTGLRCPSQCGKCCEKNPVYITPLEALPIAINLYQTGQLEFFLQKLEQQSAHDVCIFYSADQALKQGGGCTIYPLRPAFCRLFAFTKIRDSKGKTTFVACKIQKEAYSDQAAHAQSLAQTDEHFPSYNWYRWKLYDLHCELGNHEMYINDAFLRVFEHVGIYLKYREQDDVLS